MLADEGGTGGVDQSAIAAGRVYDKLHAVLAPLLGPAGVQALLVRSGRLIQGEYGFLEPAIRDPKQLCACLQGQDPQVATEAAALLFATFFALITNLIGERLTTQVLLAASPTIGSRPPTETNK